MRGSKIYEPIGRERSVNEQRERPSLRFQFGIAKLRARSGFRPEAPIVIADGWPWGGTSAAGENAGLEELRIDPPKTER